MAVSPARRRYEDALKVSCDGHRRYRSKADAAYALSWHPVCPKCRKGGLISVFACEIGPFWHCGHRWP
jgi:hypothetical protein